MTYRTDSKAEVGVPPPRSSVQHLHNYRASGREYGWKVDSC